MEEQQLDERARALAFSLDRRRVLKALAGGAIGGLSLAGLAGPRAARAAGETLTVPFSLGTTGVTTSQTYSGPVTITVSGFGQAASTQNSDAFYIFTDDWGQPVPPFHVADYYNFGLWINGGPVDNWVSPIPPYRADHTYSFAIHAPGNRLTFAFGVGDAFTFDNAGAFTVAITPGGGGRPPSESLGSAMTPTPLLSQRDPAWGSNTLGFNRPDDRDRFGNPFSIYWYGCFITSVAMLFNRYQPGYTTPADLNERLKAAGGFSPNSGLLRWPSLNTVAPAGVTWPHKKGGGCDVVDRQLAAGVPVPIDAFSSVTNQHMVVVVGKEAGSYLINDPWDGGRYVWPNGALAGSGYRVSFFHIFGGP